MSSVLIKNATIINEGKSFNSDLLIEDELIRSIGASSQMKIPAGY
jgi:dihydroorotase-like cyclic amidohydrolase